MLDSEYRINSLKKIKRWNMQKQTNHISNVYLHSRRVFFIVEEIIKCLEGKVLFDQDLTRILALIHDDLEIITGDFDSQLKSKLNKKEYNKTLFDAINKLSKNKTEIIKFRKKEYNYGELLNLESFGNTIETQIVKFADKFDTFNELLTEVFTGNLLFTKKLDGYDKIPFEFSYSFFENIEKKLNKIPFNKINCQIFKKIKFIETSKIVKKYSNIKYRNIFEIKTNYPFELWKQILQKYGNYDDKIIYKYLDI